MPKSPRYKKAEIAEALRRTLGVRSAAANALGCVPATITKYLKQYPDLADVQREAEASAIDLAESKLYKLIQSGNLTAIMFFLRTKGRGRGYNERYEISGPDGKDIAPPPPPTSLRVEFVDACICGHVEGPHSWARDGDEPRAGNDDSQPS
jgi:Bacterial regulatory protein, Fis family